MTEDDARAEAVKRNRNKSKFLSHMVWDAVHTSDKGWHVQFIQFLQGQPESHQSCSPHATSPSIAPKPAG